MKIINQFNNSMILKTDNGHRISICEHNGEFHINVLPKNTKDNMWYKINMDTKSIDKSKWNTKMPILKIDNIKHDINGNKIYEISTGDK